MSKFSTVCSGLISTPVVVVDVGADGLLHEMGGLAELCEIHAVEPRDESFEQLAPLNDGSRYGKRFYYHKGLARTAGPHTLYVTRVPQASSLLKPNRLIIDRWRDDHKLDVIGETLIECMTLADLVRSAGVDSIDLIKLDTQGSELDILLADPALLAHISIVTSEVEFVPLYEGQPLFDDVVRELSQHGFRFVGFGTTDTVDQKIIWADCLFAQRVFDDRERLLKAAMVLIEKGYLEDARWLLADHGEPSDTWQAMADAQLADQHGRSTWVAGVNKQLKAITKRSRLLESLRVRVGQILMRFPIGRAAHMIGRNRKT